MKNTQKGITLIALVITIIVMLILVGVTINLSLNGGLFGYAKQAVSETNKALAEEEMLSKGFAKVKDDEGNSYWEPIIDNYLSNSELERVKDDENDWNYIYNENGTITLTQYIGEAPENGELIVPNRYKIGDVYYVVSKVENNETNISESKYYNILGNVDDENDQTHKSEITTLKISDGVEIGVMAFYRMSSLTEVTIKKSIKEIGSYAFQNCTNVINVTMGSDVEKIDKQAFANCEQLARNRFK